MTGLKWIGVALVGVMVLAVLVFGISWALPIPAAEQQALERMQTAPAVRPAQENAFPAIWLLPYEGIEPKDRDALLAADVQRFHADPEGPGAVASLAEGRFANAEFAKWCRNEQRCLPQVRAHRAEVEAAHGGHEALHARIADLSRYRYYRSTFEPEPRMPFPSMAHVLERTSAHALLHVQGESQRALEGLCQDVSSARMLMAEGDTLLVAMVGGAWAGRNAELFTDILAELPAGTAVPPACARAFAPPQLAELDLCHAMRGEFEFQQAAMDQVPDWQHLFLNKRKTLARNAWLLSRTCVDEVQVQIRDDVVVTLPPPPSVWTMHCLANAVGCVLGDIAGPAYDQYPQRLQDVGAQLRMAGAMLWLHDQPRGEGDAAQALAGVPAGFASEGRPWWVSGDGKRVEVMRLGPARNGSEALISAPLPAGWAAP